MKGKGKSLQEKEKEKDRDIKDCPLQFPDFTTVDHGKECPKYAEVLDRGETGSVSLEELDQVQADIEILLASVGKRLKILGVENQTLLSWTDKKEVKKSGKGTETPTQTSTPTKRKGTPTSEDKERDKTSKKSKESNSGKGSQTSTPTPRSKGKNSQSKGQPEEAAAGGPGDTGSGADLPKLPKNDAVNRFWASVEPYCTPIGADDLRIVEELLKSYEEDSEYMKIPPLGVHYTQRWAQEDLMEEQSDGTKINDKKKTNEASNGDGIVDTTAILKKREQKKPCNYLDDSPFGPLTQRLVSALIEDNLMTPMDDSMADVAENGTEAVALSPTSLAKQLNIGNPATLERRIRKELEEQGILEKEEEEEEDDPNDEVLAELRRKQQELRAISQQNVNILKSLYRQGQEDMARQESKKKLMAIDSEVMDAFRKIQQAKLKKKSPTKKEKDAVMKALKEREAIMKTLEV